MRGLDHWNYNETRTGSLIMSTTQNVDWKALLQSGDVEHIGLALAKAGNVVDLEATGIGNEGAAVLAQALSEKSSVQTLNLSNNRIGAEGAAELVQALCENSSVHTLDLSNNCIGSEGTAALAQALTLNTCLHSLCLCGNSIGDEGVSTLAQVPSQNSSLHTFDLGNNCIGDEGAAALANVLGGNSTLQTLRLDHNSIGDEGAAVLAQALSASSCLQTLHLSSNRLGAQGTAALAQALSQNTCLHGLYLHDNSIGDVGAAAIAQALSVNSSLQTLHLDSNGIGAEGAAALANGLTGNSTLQTLQLDNNSIGDSGVAALVQALGGDSCLQTLHLSSNRLGAEGAAALAQALPVNTCLHSLYLHHNSIGDAGAAALAQAMSVNSSLQALHLDSNSIGDEGAAALATGLAGDSCLQTLNLNSNSIGADGAAALANGLVGSSSLQTLNLDRNSVGDIGAVALAHALSENSSVNTLYLGHNSIGGKGAEALAQALNKTRTLQTLNLGDNNPEEEGGAALAQALEYNHTCWYLDGVDEDAVKQRLSRNKEHADAFLAAARSADTAAMQEQLNWGVHIDAWSDRENTALTIAVRNNDAELCAWLIGRGANPLTRPFGTKPNALELAQSNGKTAILELLSAAFNHLDASSPAYATATANVEFVTELDAMLTALSSSSSGHTSVADVVSVLYDSARTTPMREGSCVQEHLETVIVDTEVASTRHAVLDTVKESVDQQNARARTLLAAAAPHAAQAQQTRWAAEQDEVERLVATHKQAARQRHAGTTIEAKTSAREVELQTSAELVGVCAQRAEKRMAVRREVYGAAGEVWEGVWKEAAAGEPSSSLGGWIAERAEAQREHVLTQVGVTTEEGRRYTAGLEQLEANTGELETRLKVAEEEPLRDLPAVYSQERMQIEATLNQCAEWHTQLRMLCERQEGLTHALEQLAEASKEHLQETAEAVDHTEQQLQTQHRAEQTMTKEAAELACGSLAGELHRLERSKGPKQKRVQQAEADMLRFLEEELTEEYNRAREERDQAAAGVKQVEAMQTERLETLNAAEALLGKEASSLAAVLAGDDRRGSSNGWTPPGSPLGSEVDSSGEESLEVAWSDLSKGELLGEGGFAFVYKGMLRGSTPVAIKMMKVQVMDAEHTAAFNHEVRTMKGLKHRNMITLHGVCVEPEHVCMVTELCELGSLHKLLHERGEGAEGLSEEAKVQIARDVADGMAYLHGYIPPIMHRDLKPENVLLDRRGVARISDFGLSRVKEHTQTKTRSGAGSWQYMAPELLVDDDDTDSDEEEDAGASSSVSMRTFDEKVDVFAFGMLLWEMMHEEQPYSGKKNYGLTRHMAKLMKRPETREKIDTSVCPGWATKLIEQCWATDPSQRPPFTQIVATLDTVEVMKKEEMHSQVEIVSILHEMQGTQAQILDAVQFDHEAWQAQVAALDPRAQEEIVTALKQVQSDTESLKRKSGQQSKAIRFLGEQVPQMRTWLTEVQTRAEAQGLNAADVDIVRAQLAAMEQDVMEVKERVSSQGAAMVGVQARLVTVEIGMGESGEDDEGV